MLMLPSLSSLDASLTVSVYLCTSPTDMRKGFDSLATLVSRHLGRDPFSGDLFLFLSRRRDRLKGLLWQPDGFALWYKRLEAGTYRLPACPAGAVSVTLKASELAMLLDGIDLKSVRRMPRYRRAAGGTASSE
ncbi:MAG TPA: IS66 family insertion sequence element accessory protein TnpB [Phycisphaerae bacterium]|nr:IS66 family insertion sequence element accessory protein TnpB [Phycisphaerae bacterium]